MSCIYTLHNFEGILKNQWRERVYLHKLIDLQDTPEHKAQFKDLWRKWLTVLPYRRMADASAEEFYPEYRTKVFDAFIMHDFGKFITHFLTSRSKYNVINIYLNNDEIWVFPFSEKSVIYHSHGIIMFNKKSF